jgi:hypothetical protein
MNRSGTLSRPISCNIGKRIDVSCTLEPFNRGGKTMFKPAKAMFQSMQCRLKGHVYVDSRSQPGTRVCVRCQDRRPFEGLRETSGDAEQSAHPRAGQD